MYQYRHVLARMRQVAFSVPTFVIGGRILTKVGSGIADWSDLHGKVIGVAQGTHTEQLVNALVATPAYAGTRVLTLKDHAQGLLALETGRIDGYVTDDIVGVAAATVARCSCNLACWNASPTDPTRLATGSPPSRARAGRTRRGSRSPTRRPGSSPRTSTASPAARGAI